MFLPQTHIALGDPETRESSSERQVKVFAGVQPAFIPIQVNFGNGGMTLKPNYRFFDNRPLQDCA